MIAICREVKKMRFMFRGAFSNVGSDENLLARGPRTKLKNEQTIFGKFGHELGVVDLSSERRAMIFKGPSDVVHVAAKGSLSDVIKPISVIE